MTNIFVGNLDSGTTAETVRGLFTPLGTVRRFRMVTHPATGLGRGIAFVWMGEAEAGPAIAALDGRVVDGKAIQVRPGRPQLRRALRRPDGGSDSLEPRAGDCGM